ncbi:hypothetical protein GCM10010129_80520 [Streptomyces fumigatiscleroticus]|nr:hypothetical protein GCM10010129_80520 [Streptomyces fumigatiscleroticus]
MTPHTPTGAGASTGAVLTVRDGGVGPCPPGALRVRPLPGEATTSYLTRLATAYQLTPGQLLDGLHITTTNAPTPPPAGDIHLSAEATRRLAAFARTPSAHLARALSQRPPPAAIGTAGTATARWHTVDCAVQPLPACTCCTIRRSPYQAVPAWVHPPPDLPRALICTRHQQAAADPRHNRPLDIRDLPELTRARHTSRRPPTTASLAWATTITTRWYDHHQHLHQRWRSRLNRLTTTNPHLTKGPASPALTCRGLITYPETLTLATTLDHLPPHPPAHPDPRPTAFLAHLATRLGLPRLAPADHDLLRTRLTTH